MSEQQGPRLVIRPEDLPPEPGREKREVRSDRLPAIAAALGVASVLIAGLAIGPVAVATGLLAGKRVPPSDKKGRRLVVVALAGGALGIVLWAIILFLVLRGRAGDTPTGLSGEGNVSASSDLDVGAVDVSPEPVRRAVLSNISLELWGREGTVARKVGSGSGTAIAVVGDACYILTCAHVVQQSKGRGTILRAGAVSGSLESCDTLWVSVPEADLAVVRCGVPAGQAAPSTVPLGDPETLRIGESVFAVGNPLGLEGTVLAGIVSAKRTLGDVAVIQVQVPLNPGNSGGGLYDGAGRLVGVNSYRRSDMGSAGLGFSVSLKTLWSVLEGAPGEVREVLKAAHGKSEEPRG